MTFFDFVSNSPHGDVVLRQSFQDKHQDCVQGCAFNICQLFICADYIDRSIFQQRQHELTEMELQFITLFVQYIFSHMLCMATFRDIRLLFIHKMLRLQLCILESSQKGSILLLMQRYIICRKHD